MTKSADKRRGLCRAVDARRLGLERLEDRQLLTVNISGNGNTDAASLLAAGGPGNVNAAGFVNVGRGSTNNTSVTYLGGGWVITANHVTIDNNVGPIRFGASNYQVDMSSITQLRNADDSPTDLKVFRLTTDPGLPSILPSLISSATPTGRQIMIGNGLSQGVQRFWTVDKNSPNWIWTQQAAPADPGQEDYAGYDAVSPRVIRWGENHVNQASVALDYGNGTFVHAYSTQFDNLDYTGTAPLPHEAQGTVGDSGGAVFTFSGGQWKLAGIMVVIGVFNSQPASTAVFGTQTYIADMSYYRDSILEITSSVQDRGLFYEGSSRFDAAGTPVAPLPYANDNAIASDKAAYLPGTGAATFANVSSYSRGINGLYVDVAGLRPNIKAADFVFKVGNNNTPSSWAVAPDPLSVVVRPGAGLSGSDRVEITWADGAIRNTWLQVTLAANANTGLAKPDVFFFGNAVGDTGLGNSATQATVNATDELAVRNNSEPLFANISITNIYDFNRDGVVNITDALLSRNFPTSAGNVVRFLNLSNPPAAPEAAPLVAVETQAVLAGLVLPVLPADEDDVPPLRTEPPLVKSVSGEQQAVASVFAQWESDPAGMDSLDQEPNLEELDSLTFDP